MKADVTKRALAQSVKELVSKHPLESVSVKDITDHCGLSRHGFYYHFRDKQNLVSWVFKNEVMVNLEQKWPRDIYRDTVAFFKAIEKDKEFYINVFKYEGQNSLSDFLYNWNRKDMENYLRSFVDENNQYKELLEDEFSFTFVVNLMAHTLSGPTIDWIRMGMKSSAENAAEVIANVLSDFLPSFLKETYRMK